MLPARGGRFYNVPMLKSLLRRPEMRASLGRLLGLYLRWALRTTRWRFEGWEFVTPHLAGQPGIFACWHDRLPLMPALWVEARRSARPVQTRVHALVSQHRDGQLVGAVMRRFQVGLVHGSSSRGGASVMRAMIGLLSRGELIVITPDGPRGPRHRAAPGVAQLAAVTGARVLACAAQTSRRKVLPGWDRMVLPLPFGRGVVVCSQPIEVPRGAWREAIPLITEALDRATERADRCCAG